MGITVLEGLTETSHKIYNTHTRGVWVVQFTCTEKRRPHLMQILQSIGQALQTSFSMFWEVLWPLILGFTLSGIVQAVVSHNALAKTLGCDGPKCLTFATLFGIAS